MAFALGTTWLPDRIHQGVSCAFAWWGRSLSSCVPSAIRALCASNATLVLIRRDDDGLIAVRRANRLPGRTRYRQIFRGPACDLPIFLRQNRLRLGLTSPIVIEIPASACLVREVHVPSAALARLPQVLTIDLERATPFRQSDVFSGHIVDKRNTSASANVHHIILKKSVIGDLLQACSSAGTPVSGISVLDGERLSDRPVILTESGGKLALTPAVRRLNYLTWVLAGASVIAWAASSATDIYQAQSQLDVLRTEVAALQRQATALRQQQQSRQQKATDATAPHRRKAREPMIVALLEEITRALPDQAFISEFRFAEGAITIDGLARSSADLVALLNASPSVREASFVSPVTRDVARGLERFRMKLVLRRSDAS